MEEAFFVCQFILQLTLITFAFPISAMADASQSQAAISSFDDSILIEKLVDNPCFESGDAKRVVPFSEFKKLADLKKPLVTKWYDETFAIFETTCRKSKKQFLLLFKIEPGESVSVGSLTGFEFSFCSFKIDSENKKITIVSSPVKDCKRETKEIVFFTRFPTYGRLPPPIQSDDPPVLKSEDFSKNETGFESRETELMWNSLHDARFTMERIDNLKNHFPEGVTFEVHDLVGPEYDLFVFKTPVHGIHLGLKRRFWIKHLDFSNLDFKLDSKGHDSQIFYSRVRLSLKPTTIEERNSLTELKNPEKSFRWELFTYSTVVLGMTATIPGLIQNSRYPIANLLITSGLILPTLFSKSSLALGSAIIGIPYGLSSLAAYTYARNSSGNPIVGSAIPSGILWIPFFVTSLNF